MSRSPTSNVVDLSPVAPGGGVAQRHPEPRLELRHAEGLRHEVVGPAVERLHLAALVAVGGQDHDRHVRELSDAAADLQAVEVGQTQIEDDEVRRRQRHLVDGLCARMSDQHVIPTGRQPDAQRP
jgi:hypothetical protein